MANITVKGVVTGDKGQSLKYLKVSVCGVSGSVTVSLGDGTTDEIGEYQISVKGCPKIIVRVHDYVGRVIFESQEYYRVFVESNDIPTIVIPDADLSGFLATLRTGTPAMLSANNLVTPLIDNKVAWEQLTLAVQAANTFIKCSQLYFDVGFLLTVFNPPQPVIGSPTTGVRLENEILTANTSRHVATEMVLNDFECGPYPTDTAGLVEDYISTHPSTIQYQRFKISFLAGSLHAKFTIVDGKKAIMNASPLLQEYFDDTTHKIDDARRGMMIPLKNSIRVPVHDVSVQIQGPALEDLERTFDVIWRKASLASSTIPAFVPPATSNAAVQIVRTLPANVFTNRVGGVLGGEQGILEAYLRAIAAAEDFIYIENQYVTEPQIPHALLMAMGQKPNLQVILLINNKVDLPKYQTWQTKLIRQFIHDAQTQLDEPENPIAKRLGIFTRWTHEYSSEPDGYDRIIRNYIHSKTAVVDDKWATIGSANLDGVSLSVSQFALALDPGLPGISSVRKNILQINKAVEVNALIFNGVDGQPASDVPGNLRRTLWAEHLGLSGPNDSLLQTRPAEGWLKIWNDAAAEKLRRLRLPQPQSHPAAVLEWRGYASAVDELGALGVVPGEFFAILDEVDSFSFTKGKWVASVGLPIG